MEKVFQYLCLTQTEESDSITKTLSKCNNIYKDQTRKNNDSSKSKYLHIINGWIVHYL